MDNSAADDVSGGRPDAAPGSDEAPHDTDDLVRRTLADAQRSARRRPRRRRRTDGRPDPSDGTRTGGYTAPGPDPRDPQPLGSVLEGHIADQGWDRQLSQARVFADWAGLVGQDVAAHCHPTALRAGELRISAESTAWATQLRLLTGTLLQRLAADLGPEVVTRLVITGPTGPSWRHGAWSVRGARGPRDTYG